MLLERDQDLAALAARIGALYGSREGGAVLIEGPPGIGKSALLAAALAKAPDAEQVLRARGSELEAGPAFRGLRPPPAGRRGGGGPGLGRRAPAARPRAAPPVTGPAPLAALRPRRAGRAGAG